MARWAPQKKDQLAAIAAEISHNYGHGRTLIAIDGRHGSGQREFADDLAEALGEFEPKVFRASIDDFQLPRSGRSDGPGNSGFDFYRSKYDYSLLRRVLIDPFHTAGSTGFVLTGFDAVRDQPVFQPKWMTAGLDAVLIMDGVFLLRPELASVWNYSVWLSVPPQDSEEPEVKLRAAADVAYIDDADPSTRASTIIDNQDPEHPRRIFADSC
ncbi:MAG: uridine kinase [Homoserinimonas sp.]|nr:uridine kinase [Homoserinimonas sp.]MCW5944768.1 uridine kinase [Cryobacterium sp.]